MLQRGAKKTGVHKCSAVGESYEEVCRGFLEILTFSGESKLCSSSCHLEKADKFL